MVLLAVSAGHESFEFTASESGAGAASSGAVFSGKCVSVQVGNACLWFPLNSVNFLRTTAKLSNTNIFTSPYAGLCRVAFQIHVYLNQTKKKKNYFEERGGGDSSDKLRSQKLLGIYNINRIVAKFF